MIRRIICVVLLACLSGVIACNRKELLNEKPNSDLVIPSTYEDLQALLDNEKELSQTPVLTEVSGDNYYVLSSSFWLSLGAKERNGYVWEKDLYGGEVNIEDWNIPYKQVFYANVVLQGLSAMPANRQTETEWKALQGSALFIRSFAFYNIAQLFSPPYDPAIVGAAQGIPLRLTPNINEASVRSSVQQTYEQITSDLKEAARMLPPDIATNLNRPCKPAAYLMLARVYLSMREYGKAGKYADSCLQLYSTLINYDSVNLALSVPFNKLNKETLYQSKVLTSTRLFRGLSVRDLVVDSTLYRSYTSDDLRKDAFFVLNSSGFPNPKGSYSGTLFPFTGLATDEAYLIKAECLARASNINTALDVLNALLKNRWRKNTFIPFTAASNEDALALILTERRKELPFRGVRWSDIRRLNKDCSCITLKRVLDGKEYKLPPNDNRFVLLIPPDVIALSGMNQNP